MLTGCVAPEPKPASSDLLSGTRWSLVSIGGSPVLAGESTSMRFEKGRLSGSDGCNRYSTSYVASESKLSISSNIMGTRMACPPAIMEEAAAFTSILSRAAGYRLDGDRLTLLERDGRPLASFKRTEP